MTLLENVWLPMQIREAAERLQSGCGRAKERLKRLTSGSSLGAHCGWAHFGKG